MNENDGLEEDIDRLLRDPEWAELIQRRADELGVSTRDYVLDLARRDAAGAEERSAIRSIAMARRKRS